jgi:hypothetical protein
MNTMLKLVNLLIFALPIVLIATRANSQMDYYYVGNHGYPVIHYGGYYRHPVIESRAVTPAESYAKGLSSIIRAKGEYNLATSAAMINLTEARRRYIENREFWVRMYFLMRLENREFRAQERGPRPSAEQILRYARMEAPKPLKADMLDRTSGKINWPLALTASEYESDRRQLEELFARLGKQGDISMESFLTIRNLTNKMLKQLNGEILDIPSIDYVKAKQFLTSLAYEPQRAAENHNSNIESTKTAMLGRP